MQGHLLKRKNKTKKTKKTAEFVIKMQGTSTDFVHSHLCFHSAENLYEGFQKMYILCLRLMAARVL